MVIFDSRVVSNNYDGQSFGRSNSFHLPEGKKATLIMTTNAGYESSIQLDLIRGIDTPDGSKMGYVNQARTIHGKPIYLGRGKTQAELELPGHYYFVVDMKEHSRIMGDLHNPTFIEVFIA